MWGGGGELLVRESVCACVCVCKVGLGQVVVMVMYHYVLGEVISVCVCGACMHVYMHV